MGVEVLEERLEPAALEGRGRLAGGALAGVSRSIDREDLLLDGGGDLELLVLLDELFCVRPLTLSSSATAKKELSSSCATFTSP